MPRFRVAAAPPHDAERGRARVLRRLAPRARRERGRVPTARRAASMHAVLRSRVGVPVTVDVDLGAPAAATINSDGMLTIPKDAVKFTTDAHRRRAGARHRDLARRCRRR